MTEKTVSPAVTADQPEAVTRYFSFGGDHFDPRTGESLWKKYVTVIAPDSEACRTAMFAKYGRAWSMEYIPGWPGHDERIARWTEHERIDTTNPPAGEAPVSAVEHYEKHVVIGEGKGDCGVKCACGFGYVGLDSVAEASDLLAVHIAASQKPADAT